MTKLSSAKERMRTLLALSRLDPSLLPALVALAQSADDEHIRAQGSPSISDRAIVHPLATLRFTERVRIEAGATIGPFCCVWGGWSRTWATVGAEALLSPGVILVAGNHLTDGSEPIKQKGFEELDVTIGPGSWIGAHAVVIGCTVGEGAVVGAGAVVTKDVPPFAIAVGSPARVVGFREGSDVR